ncbi:MAG: chloride channel protein [Oligoflexus sp.]
MTRIKLGTLCVAVGILAGIAVSAFLFSLEWATQLRLRFPVLLYALPIGGLLVAFIYHHFGQSSYLGNHLILEEFHHPRQALPWRMAPFVFLGTVVTHLLGGSAGREGTAVQIGAVLADQWRRFFPIQPHERQVLLAAGISAGFGAAIGVPFAGMIFGMEVTQIGKIRIPYAIYCLLASFAGYLTCLVLQAPHSEFISFLMPQVNLLMVSYLLGVGLLFGLCARSFSYTTHKLSAVFAKYMPYPPLRALVGGILLVALFSWEGSGRFLGLGMPVIHESLQTYQSIWDPIKKLFFTALTLAAGFKGGEFTPLVFIGATLGSAVAELLAMPPSFLAALGFAAVFAGCANTPLACAVMAAELFGWRILPFSLLTCYLSHLVSGYLGIYQHQLIVAKKWQHFARLWGAMTRRGK